MVYLLGLSEVGGFVLSSIHLSSVRKTGLSLTLVPRYSVN